MSDAELRHGVVKVGIADLLLPFTIDARPRLDAPWFGNLAFVLGRQTLHDFGHSVIN